MNIIRYETHPAHLDCDISELTGTRSFEAAEAQSAPPLDFREEIAEILSRHDAPLTEQLLSDIEASNREESIRRASDFVAYLMRCLPKTPQGRVWRAW